MARTQRRAPRSIVAVACAIGSLIVAACGPATTEPVDPARSLAATGDGAPDASVGLLRPTAVAVQVPPDSVVAFDPTALESIATVQVGGDPLLLAVAGGHIWTADLADGALSRIDPVTLERTQVRLQTDIVGIGATPNDVWAAVADRRLVRLRGSTGEESASFELAKEPLFRLRDAGFLAVDGDTAWVTIPVLGQSSAPQSLWRVDLADGSLVSRHDIGRDPLTPIVAFGGVWVPTRGARDLVRVDAVTGERSVTTLEDDPAVIAAGADSLWVGLGRSKAVLRLTPDADQEVARVAVGSEIRGVTFAQDLLWVATERSVTAIDPVTNAVAIELPFESESGQGPIGIAELAGRIWVSVE